LPSAAAANIPLQYVSAMSSQHFDVQQDGDVTVVTLTSPELLDHLVTHEMQDELFAFAENEKPKRLIVDFQQVRRCSTEIINAMLRTRKRVAGAGGDVRLCGMHKHIRDVFRMLNLEGNVFEIFDTLDEAKQNFVV
jgi:anti-anti-sigma factor